MSTFLDEDKIREYKSRIKEIKSSRKKEVKRTVKYEIRKLFMKDLNIKVKKIIIDKGVHTYENDPSENREAKPSELISKNYYEIITITFGKDEKIVFLYIESFDTVAMSLNNYIDTQICDVEINTWELDHISSNVSYFDKKETYMFETNNHNDYIFKCIDTSIYAEDEWKTRYIAIRNCMKENFWPYCRTTEYFKTNPVYEYRRIVLLILLAQKYDQNSILKKLPKDIAILIAKKVYSFRNYK
jgi:hypothetical protein